ncbi:hypothetical protein [Metabacillus endolithicus]|uniref:Uncharacterized protein n=1 Tax=Metabacillus endolithicus TaxID=1535204 RepID=A0ABW5BTI9_9BACI|nr:hypothetical protein [Metabacillus endolithicus]UPG63840.1 hypothetical protein MVE64_01340 [Metabacillus endolithicus]
MFEKLRKVSMRTAVIMGCCFYSLTILIHILIIMGIIPLTWVNGGRSESFENQLPISILNLITAIIGVLFTVTVGANIQSKFNRWITTICWFFVVLWTYGFIQQLFGTLFEKMVCSLILLLGVISSLRMAIEKR